MPMRAFSCEHAWLMPPTLDELVPEAKRGPPLLPGLSGAEWGNEAVLAADCIVSDGLAGRGGQSALGTARKADGDDLSADLSLGRLPSQGGEVARAADGQHGNVQIGVPAEDQRLVGVAAVNPHVDGPDAIYDVMVRGDESGGLLDVEDQARAGRQ